MNVYYSPEYVGSHFAFETTRKAKWVADSLTSDPISEIVLLRPVPLHASQLERVHTPHYVRSICTGEPLALAQSQELKWDAGLWQMVLASNGGALAAAHDAMSHGISGSLSSGLHHARADRGAGYCTLNGLVVGAFAAKGAGAKRVLIVDFDAHCGGGTASLIEGHDGIEQIDVSVSPYDQYPSRPTARLVVSDGRDYLGDIQRMLATVESPRTVNVVIYNAGMDPHHAAGGVGPIDAEVLRAREAMVFEWANSHGLPVAWVLAGGYTLGIEMPELVDLHMLTLEAAVGAYARS